MQFLARQWHTRRGPLDLLLLDQDGRLAVAELKLEFDDEMLMQGLDYLAWVHENLEGVARAFPEHRVLVDQAPRLILIAKSFSDILRSRARYLAEEMQPTLLTYKAILHADERLVVLSEIDVGEAPRPPVGPIRELVHRDYLVGDELRSLWDKTAEHIQSLAPDVLSSPTASYLGFKFRGRLIANLYPCRRHFWVGHYEEGEWSTTKVADADDVNKVAQRLDADYIKQALLGTPE